MLRRSVLVVMTALLVARPLVLGEDPTFSSSFSDAGTLVLSLLTLCAAAAWAAWRFWTKQTRWYAGFVELGLLVIVLAAFAGVNIASNKHAAWLTAWEWFVLLVGFTTLRQLAVTAEEKQGFLAVLLATVVSLALYAAYQASVELPATGDYLKRNPTLLEDRVREAMLQRAEDGHVFGTFAHPNSFAGYLVLFVPALFGLAWLVRHRGYPSGQRLIILALAVIALGGLYLTHSRGAILGLILSGALVSLLVGWTWLRANPAYLLVGLLGILAFGYLLTQGDLLAGGLKKNTQTMAVRLEYWNATSKMIADHPIQGVGGGNFAGYYPRYMAVTSVEKIRDPHNLFLEQWATLGLAGLAGLILVLGAYFWSQRRLVTESDKLLQDDPAPAPTSPAGAVRWEFYVGGMIGLVIGFAMRALGQDAETVVQEALVAGGRTVVFFMALALFEKVVWPERLRALVLNVGILALLANLCVSGGIGYPSVMTLLLAAMALALNSPLPPPVSVAETYANVATTAPLPLAIGILLAYFAGVFYPTTAASTLVHDATLRGRIYLEDQLRPPAERVIKLPAPQPSVEGRNSFADIHYRYLDANILKPLLQAQDLDRWNPRIPGHIAQWKAQLWRLTRYDRQLAREAIAWAQLGQQLDPRSWDGYRTEVLLHHAFAQRLEFPPFAGLGIGPAYAVALRQRERDNPAAREQREMIREEHRAAAAAYERLAVYDPSDPLLFFEIAQEYAVAGDENRCRKAAQRALELDEEIRGAETQAIARNRSVMKRPQSLTDENRLQLHRWMAE